MIKIGFVFFDGLHIIPHFIGSVAELHKDPDCTVDILTPETSQDYLFLLLDKLSLPSNIVKKLPTYLYKKIAYKIQKREKPSNRFIFNKHKKELLNYDILVFNVFNHMHLKRENRNPKFVFLMHGAGDRDYPFLEQYKKPISEFDLITTAGQKINDLFYKMGNFTYTKFEICGYQKLDIIQKNKKKFFNNDNPIVLYNPHFEENVTSFNHFGLQLFDFFYKNPSFNLIFAPHFNLFGKEKKKALKREIIDQKYLNVPNILIDFGSINAVDMSYTLAADVYLGDVSSQVYEFLLFKQKPCIFINAHGFDWKSNSHFQNWHLGKVIDNLTDFREILLSRENWQKDYKQKQKKAIEYTFSLTEETASKRVAAAIKKLVE